MFLCILSFTVVAFLIPLKSRVVSADWEVTSWLLGRTLQSISNQTDSNHRTFVVCHEAPSGLPKSVLGGVEFVYCDFSPPAAKTGAAMGSDKVAKLRKGLERIEGTDASHVMKLDADDLIDNRLCSFVAHTDADLTVCRSGLIVGAKVGHFCVHERENFHRVCGSSAIYRSELLNASDGVLRQYFLSDDHQTVIETAQAKGLSIATPPFPAVCYVQSTGFRLSNAYHPDFKPTLRYRLGALRRSRIVTQATRMHFGYC